MAEMLQALIDKLQSEAVDEAESRARAIVEDAEARAAHLLAEAQRHSEALRREAERRAEAHRERGERALEQAARDLLLRLRQEVLATVQELARPGLARALDEGTLRRMLVTMVETYAARDGAPRRARVLLSESDRALLEAHYADLFREALADGVELRADPDVDHGFRLRFDGRQVEHDVTVDALSSALASMVRADLASLLRRVSAGSTGAETGGEPTPSRSEPRSEVGSGPTRGVEAPPTDAVATEPH